MIGGNAQMGRPALDHLQDRMQHAGHGAIGFVAPLVETPQAVEMPKELVSAVDEVDDHAAG